MLVLNRILLLVSMILAALPVYGLSGDLEVTSESLRVKRDDGFYVRFYPGRYPVSLTFGRAKLHFSILRKDIQTSVTLRFPPGTTIPQNGVIAIDGTKTGQSFSVTGPIQTDVVASRTYHEQEGCTYYSREWVCRGRDHKGHPICRWEDIPRRGFQEVEYYFETKTVSLRLELNSDNGGVANIAGTESSSRKIYTHIGRCW